jgi:hypothetical protein
MKQSVGSTRLVGRNTQIALMIFMVTLASCSSQRDSALKSTTDTETSMPSVATEPTQAPQTTPTNVAIFDIGNGLHFALGQLLDDFKKQHASSHCFDSSFVGCEIMEPDAADCPSTEVCQHVVYTFQSQKLDGFSVEYPSATWRQILAASTKKFGHSQHKNTHIGSMGIETSKWKLADGNSLTFVHYSGSDLNGSAIARPFSVQYGSDAE